MDALILSCGPAPCRPRPVRSAPVRLLTVSAVVLVVGCDRGPSEPEVLVPATLTHATAANQEADAGATVQVGVQVRTDDARAVPGVVVVFRVTDGGGEIQGSATTDQEGTATVEWRLGTSVGPNAAEASVSDLEPLTFRASTRPGAPVALEAIFGDGQSAPSATTLPYILIARVTDQHGNPTPGVPVTFEPLEGGAVAFPLLAESSSTGLVAARWRLGASSGPQRLRVSAPAGSLEGELRATARSVSPGFDIEVMYENPGAFTPAQREAIEAGVRKARSVFASAPPPISFQTPAFDCGGVHVPAFDRSFSNPVVVVALRRFGTTPPFEDVAESVLGLGGPCVWVFHPQQSRLRRTILGRIVLGEASIARLAAEGSLESTVTHELFHALGLGPLWRPDEDLGWEDMLEDRGGVDPRFTGSMTIAAWGATPGNVEGSVPVPVANEGATGSRDAHWRATPFGEELMLPNLGLNMPVSRVSVASFADLSYQVNPAEADPFVVPPATETLAADALAELSAVVVTPGVHACAVDGLPAHRGAALDVETGRIHWTSVR